MKRETLRIYDDALLVVRELGPVIETIKRRSKSLGDQLERAVSSVPLAIAEGAWATGGNRRDAYQRGVNEMRESIACCDVAVARGFVAEVPTATSERMRKVVGTLVNALR